MNELPVRYDVSKKDLAKGRNLKVAAIAAPLGLAAVPAVVFSALFVLFGTTPPVAATFLFLGMIVTAFMFFAGLVVSGVLVSRRSKWMREMRERIAADGIRAEEIDWFRNELRSNEKKALKSIEASDVLLGDAYRETLASRLTATRIIRTTRREMNATRQRMSRIKRLNSETSEKYAKQIESDGERIASINAEAKQMLAEAETRLQMIEAAASRGGHLADSELALKKLSARTERLPLALQEARIAEEILAELESADENDRTALTE